LSREAGEVANPEATRGAGDPKIIGQRMRLNGREATIVGVAPSVFAFPKGAEVWQPLIAAPGGRSS
jgi:hypothetical protein